MSLLRSCLLLLSLAALSPVAPAAWADPKPPIHGTLVPYEDRTVLAARDFTTDLPLDLQQAAITCQSATFQVDDRAPFQVLVHYDQLDAHPTLFRRAEIATLSVPLGVTVSASFGEPTNRGTTEQPVMTVPFLLQWSGDGWLRTGQWILHPDGTLVPVSDD